MLKLTNIKKSFGGIHALKDVSLEVNSGEIHAILGENGAGKSTLMKIISGAHQADSGTLTFNGVTVNKNSPHLAQENGIRIIYQEFALVPALTVSENIYLGQKSTSAWWNADKMNEKAAALIAYLGFDLDVRKLVSQLSVAEQQIVEIAKALSQDVKLLILDEPSAVLGTQEIHKLFSLLLKLKNDGVAIIYISHHLDELLEITDRITVLKDGTSIQTVATASVTKNDLITLMVGRELQQIYPEKPSQFAFEEQIEITDLVTSVQDNKQNFTLRKGEILGIGGLVGSGRTQILESLFGLLGSKAALIAGQNLRILPKSPRYLIKQGWGMVPEDRKKHGGLLNLSIRENISLASLNTVSNKFGFINLKKERDQVTSLVQRLQTKIGHIEDPLISLSGGNQQKIILAKWLNLDLKVLLVDEPTRGVDVGARAEIYSIIQELANSGIYIVMVSSDIEELMGLSDRILVINKGSIQGELNRPEFSEENILRMAIGAN